jgi:hypothetical protein
MKENNKNNKFIIKYHQPHLEIILQLIKDLCETRKFPKHNDKKIYNIFYRFCFIFEISMLK